MRHLTSFLLKANSEILFLPSMHQCACRGGLEAMAREVPSGLLPATILISRKIILCQTYSMEKV